MDITSFIVSERENALLTGDYNTYRSQTSRRIHALRKRLGQATPRGRKYTSRPAITAENVGKNQEYVKLLLVSAERAWANAMAMQNAQSPETTQKPMPGSTKRQIVSRLRKAIMYADQLVEILKDETTTHASKVDMMEARAYSSSLKGSLQFEKRGWQACIEKYSIARLVYTTLGSSAQTDIFKDLTSTIDTSIRYAAYQLKFPRTKPIPEIAVKHFPQTERVLRSHIEELDPGAFVIGRDLSSARKDGLKDLPTTISWRSRSVKIVDAAISEALGLAMSKEIELSSTFEKFQKETIGPKDLATAYDDVINARQDVVEATKKATDDLAKEGVSPSDGRMQALAVTKTAVNYAVIEWRIGRNRVLCGTEDGLKFEAEQARKLQKPRKDGKERIVKEESTGRQLARLRERVALYDATLQSLDDVKALPGVAADSDFVAELAGKRNYFQALKCLAIGRSHAATAQPTNALALFSRASDLSQKTAAAPSKPATASPTSEGGLPKLDVSPPQIKTLNHYIQGIVSQHRALVELEHLSTPKTTETQKTAAYDPPMIERLDEYPSAGDVDLTNLVTYPPRLQPVPVKPLFFDLAWNYIEYPGRTPAATAAAAAAVNGVAAARNEEGTTSQAEQKKGRGWFGFGR